MHDYLDGVLQDIIRLVYLFEPVGELGMDIGMILLGQLVVG